MTSKRSELFYKLASKGVVDLRFAYSNDTCKALENDQRILKKRKPFVVSSNCGFSSFVIPQNFN